MLFDVLRPLLSDHAKGSRVPFRLLVHDILWNVIQRPTHACTNPVVWLSAWRCCPCFGRLFYYHYKEYDRNIRPYYLKKDFYNFWMPIQLVYSLIIYLIIILGLLNSLKNLNWKFNLFLITSAVYMFCILGWVGNSRYFLPSLIYLSFYFGYGIKFLINMKFLNKLKNSWNDKGKNSE